MSRRCDCGCRRPARVEWISATLGSFYFGALCNIRHRDALVAAGFADFPELDDEQPTVTLVGGSADFDDYASD